MSLHFILGSPWGKLNSGWGVVHFTLESKYCWLLYKKMTWKKRERMESGSSWEATVLVHERETMTVFKIWPFKAKMIALNCAAAAAKSLQSCPTLCDPIDGSPPGSPVPGILQATTLEWVAISFSKNPCKCLKKKKPKKLKPPFCCWSTPLLCDMDQIYHCNLIPPIFYLQAYVDHFSFHLPLSALPTLQPCMCYGSSHHTLSFPLPFFLTWTTNH